MPRDCTVPKANLYHYHVSMGRLLYLDVLNPLLTMDMLLLLDQFFAQS